MNVKEAISEIISINKVIIDKEIDKHLPRTKEMQEAYNGEVKPSLLKFRDKYGMTERTFIKKLLQDSDFNQINNLKIQTFGHWGRKVNPYIWASIFIENEQNSASDSLQLYILIDSTGLKFGFDYGDNITNNNRIVENIKNDENSQQIILDAISKNNLDVINIKAGSPVILFSHDNSKNVIKTKDDFKNWSNDIHLVKNYRADSIPNDIETKIQDVINSLLPLCKNLNINSVIQDVGYWLYSAGRNANDWQNQFDNGFMSIDYDFPDNLNDFENKEDLINSRDDYGYEEGSMNTIKALWDFSKEINIGDIIISKKGRSKYLGYGVVTSDYIFNEKTIDYKHKRKVKWIKKGKWEVDGNLPVKTLTNITQYSDYVEKLKSKLGIVAKEKSKSNAEFDVDKILENVFITNNDFQNIVDILYTKKNIILQGSAGVGKTFIAKKIAQALQEDYSEERIEMIQFHQSYSYEDFIQGYRPNNDSFELKNGIFHKICERAKKDTSIPYFLIIDEINRGNLSKIFGELMMLIESDKRGEKNRIKLTYSVDEYFYIPDNLYIIGTMNTADRSLTIVDYALRRRFAFIKMRPKFNEQFEAFLLKKGMSKEIISSITKKMIKLNNIINTDDSLGYGFEIGHSYFCSYKSGEHNKWLSNVWKYEIIPLIEEYWFDDQQLVDEYVSIIES
jgi:MoxR-like ATPase/predicted Mrr-cat superfamily restriction endonuclease